jgi:hypothetical protein
MSLALALAPWSRHLVGLFRSEIWLDLESQRDHSAEDALRLMLADVQRDRLVQRRQELVDRFARREASLELVNLSPEA